MKRFFLILFLFLTCSAVSFFLKTCHYNHEAAAVAFQIRDTLPVWYGGYSRSGRLAPASWKDALPTPRPNFMPFTIESAMMFCYASDAAAGNGVPKRDLRLAYLPEVPPYAQMNMLLEWVLGWSWRAYCIFFEPAPPTPAELRFQDYPAFARFAAVEIRIWTAFISGLIFLWLAVMKTPLRYAFAGGMFHAVSAAAIARATGQDIVRGDLCIPLFMLCLVLAYSILGKPSRWKMIALFLSVFAAFAAWDLCQMLFMAWLLTELLRWLIGGRFTVRRRNIWLIITAAIVLNALLVPFNRTYGLIMSPLVCIYLPLLLLLLVRFPEPGKLLFRKRAVYSMLLLVLLGGIYYSLIDNPVYQANYSHFSEVMKAKIVFRNVKPADPELLSYDARMMWTPAMHSSTWPITVGFFPSLGSIPGVTAISGPTVLRNLWNYLPLTLAAYLLLLLTAGLFTVFRTPVLHDLPRSMLPHLFTLGFLIGYIYIVRYHEFLIIFLSAAFVLLIQAYFRGIRGIHHPFLRRGLSCFIFGWVLLLFLFEFFITARCRNRSYENESYHYETSRLIEWMRHGKAVQGKTILTEFTTGPMLMAYCGARIVLQPQFGMEPIRRPVEEYLRIIYHSTEEELSGFCRRYHVDYLLFDHGLVGPMYPDSSRYIANAREIPPECPVSKMEYRPDSLRHFYKIEPPQRFRSFSRKYALFKYISPENIRDAETLIRQGKLSWKKKDRKQAEKMAAEAIVLDPHSEQVRNFYIKVFQQIPEPGLMDFQRGWMAGKPEGTK